MTKEEYLKALEQNQNSLNKQYFQKDLEGDFLDAQRLNPEYNRYLRNVAINTDSDVTKTPNVKSNMPALGYKLLMEANTPNVDPFTQPATPQEQQLINQYPSGTRIQINPNKKDLLNML
jgi:hypothetical protein